MMRRLPCSFVLLVLAAAPLGAQQARPEPDGGWFRPVARYGKWVSFLTAAAFTGLAVREHSHSADSWDQLLEICRANNADCTVGSDGRYLNLIAENHYQRSLYFDARARRRLMAGQAALVVAATLFIADLTRGPGGPPNIPFDPNRLVVGVTPRGTAQIGWKLEF